MEIKRKPNENQQKSIEIIGNLQKSKEIHTESIKQYNHELRIM